MDDRSPTKGEMLLNRSLERERRAGVEHYKTGQHKASKMVIAEDGSEVAALGYVDVRGHACLVLCGRERPEDEWHAAFSIDAGLTTVGRARALNGFVLSPAMLRALEEADVLPDLDAFLFPNPVGASFRG